MLLSQKFKDYMKMFCVGGPDLFSPPTQKISRLNFYEIEILYLKIGQSFSSNRAKYFLDGPNKSYTLN
jgi:hypothetical protein